MRPDMSLHSALTVYEVVWRLMLPFLSRSNRLKEGIDQRLLQSPLKPADLWIQAASVGEAYLALEIVKQLRPDHVTRILLTTNTRQGMDIIDSGIKSIDLNDLRVNVQAALCPFDRPSLMQKAVNQVSPQLVVLLETEIWPALLARLKQARTPVLIVNGRITAHSLNRYRIWPRLWRLLRPEQILAISEEDGARFDTLFGHPKVSVMNNIKFDRLKLADDISSADDGFRRYLLPRQSFAVLGSIRQPEEDQVAGIIASMLAEVPGLVIGLFPRHLNRLSFWQSTLAKLNVSWMLRSEWHQPLNRGGVILWDTFGELGRAYSIARAAFVGGSLVPLGGQNFLEPMICGVRPVIGPYWDNFKWVGKQVFEQNLVRIALNGKAVTETLIADLTDPFDRKEKRKAARKYIEQHQGGTEQACRVIRSFLHS